MSSPPSPSILYKSLVSILIPLPKFNPSFRTHLPLISSSNKKNQISMDRLPKFEANYVPLTPLTFLKRANSVYANRTSLIYENTRFTWRQTYQRCCRLASSLISLNILKNNVVSATSIIMYISSILVFLFITLVN